MKKMNTVDKVNAINLLKGNQRNFEVESLQKTSEALRSLHTDFPSTEASVIKLHEALLFSNAYPGSAAILQLCNSLMDLLVQTVSKTVSKNRSAYYNSGITGSLVCAQFGLLLNQYLLQEKLQIHELSGVDGQNSELVGKLTFTLDAVEQELMPDDAGYFNKWQKRYLPGIKNSKNLLDYYIHACMQMQGSISYKENIFSSFQLFTEFSLDAKLLGLSNGRLGIGSSHIHSNGIQKKCTIEEVFLQGKPKQIKLLPNQQAHLVRLAKGYMASLLRETDTFSYAQEHETELHDIGNGISIGLYFMIPEQKFALQSYIGYLFYKNGLPMAYGGCWLFAQQAAFGVNVLQPYRGGESSNVIAQLLRLYHFRFGVQQFTVDPYQIGKGNSDGIQSGAFWFYYKLGFRPMQKDLADLAMSEMHRMNTEKGYRSPAKVLIKLADAEIYWAPSTNNASYYSLLPISDKISAHVAKNFNGNRNLALIAASKKYQKITRSKVAKNSFLNRLLTTMDAMGVFEKLKPAVVAKIGEAYQQKDGQEANAHLKLLGLKPYWQLFK